jgi:SAM-dependent methyltransferase
MSMPVEALSMPDPGDELIARVASGTDRASFFWSGRESVRELERTLAIVRRRLDSFEAILDFGCGCGRMLLWMENAVGAAALHGTDVDAEAIEWCRKHLPYARFTVNDPDPPLPYPDGAFDLVFNHSVFTHIDEQRQDRWLSELRRIVRPDGFVVLSVHGEVSLSDSDWEVRDRLQRDGIAFRENTVPRQLGLPEWYQSTWHAPWYVFEHWGRWFAIRAYLPGGDLDFQDHILLERTSAPGERPVAARPHAGTEGAPASRVRAALSSASTYRQATKTNSFGGELRALFRRFILRILRPYTLHQDKFNQAVVTSIEELSRAVEAQSARLSDVTSNQNPPNDGPR